MASQDGIIPIKGTIGNITFYKTRDGYLARQKGGVNKSRLKSDPAFIRTRENQEEFGTAGKAGKLLRLTFNSLVQKVQDTRMISRMHKEFMKVIQADTVSVRGKRNVTLGDPALLKGFEFNANGPLNTTFKTPYEATLDRNSGVAKLTIPSFIPDEGIAYPAGATHFKISIAAAEIDFESKMFVTTSRSFDALEISHESIAPINLTSNLSPASSNVLFMVVCIEFLQSLNGALYSLKNGAYNAMSIVAASGIS